MLFPLLLIVSLWTTSISAASQCPKLPDQCKCDHETEPRLTILCRGVDPTRVLKLVGGLNIDRLRFDNCSMHSLDTIPKASIRSLHFSGCNISSISEKAFLQVKDDLEELDLSNNSLVTVPLFGKMLKLAALNLNANKIKTIPEDVFEGLVNLRQLRIERNEICELDSNALNETKKTLELLDISGNCLSTIPAQNIRNMMNLMYLDLSDNKIAEVVNFQLMNLPVLKEVRLNDNLLSRIEPMAFMNVPQLQQLYMRNNLIASLDANRLQAFKQLELLDVSNNLLTKLPMIKELTALKQIRLDGNQITKIETLAFSNNPHLQMISLQDNNIDLISRNSFDSLDQLIIVLLANNSIKAIERGMLDGMRNLQQLNLRNNSLVEIDSTAFTSVPHLTSLDLAHNKLQKIQKGAFDKLPKLFWLDLSQNKLSTFERGTFDKKVANILLDGNPLKCDESLDWFVTYLVNNRVRTFLPFQPEISCAGPEKYAGTRLKDLMMKKANETLNSSLLGGQGSQRSLLTSFIPGLNALGGNPAQAAAGPMLSSITNALPALRSLPGFGQFPMNNVGGAGGAPMNRDFGSAMEQFTGPLVRFATGGQPVASDIEQLIQSIPNLVVNIPGVGDVDISKLDPNLVAHVLRGGQIPGIPKESLDAVVKQYMTKMAQVAETARQTGQVGPEVQKYLPPLDKLPTQLVTDVMAGKNLPGLDQAQTKSIKDYYTQVMPVSDPDDSPSSDKAVPVINGNTIGMLKLLPPGYDISKLPAEVVRSVTRGEIPDMNLLPDDIKEYLKRNSEKVIETFASQTTNMTLESILAKIPNFERPELETFQPYDLNSLGTELKHEELEQAKAENLRFYTALALGAVGALTIVVLSALYWHMKKHPNIDHTSLVMQRNMQDVPSPSRLTSTHVDHAHAN